MLHYQERVLPGVQVADVAVGGLREDEAAAAMTARLSSYIATPLTLEADGQRWQIAPRDLGVGYNAPEMARAAMLVGRTGSSADRLAAWWPFGRASERLQPIGAVDQAAMLKGLAPVLATVNRPAADASIQIDGGSGLTLRPSSAGQYLDVTAATLALQQRAALLSTEPVTLTLRSAAPSVTETAFASVKDSADALLGEPFTLDGQTAAGPRQWSLTPTELTAMVTLAGDDQRTLALDEGQLADRLGRVAAEVDRDGRNAGLSLDKDGTPTVAPHADGLALDIPASVAAINRAIAQGQHRSALATRVTQPAVLTADLEPARANLSRLLDRQVAVSAVDVERKLARKDLLAILIVTPRPEAPAKVEVGVDRDSLATMLASIAKQVNREARAPVYKYLGGQVSRTAEPIQGRTLDQAAALTALSDALLSADTTTVTLPVTRVDAPLASIDPSQIVIRDTLAVGTTYYGFSLPERKHNVELATSRLNGTLVPPGELFSFNRAVGRVNTASGYKTGYGIVLTNGAVQTVPSVGGGICQVATTVFHAAFRSGATIGERNWHFYWIPTYGQAPSGMTGLDATVDEDYGLDFTFRNTTGNWIAVETGYDGQNMRIALKGVKPNWEVRIGNPEVSNVKPHDPTPVERVDPSFAPGRRVQVESARDGMDVSIARTVVRDGAVVDQRTFKSHYEPSQNVTLVGPSPT